MTIMLHKHFVRFYFILIYGLSLVQEKNLYKMCMQINHCKNKFSYLNQLKILIYISTSMWLLSLSPNKLGNLKIIVLFFCHVLLFEQAIAKEGFQKKSGYYFTDCCMYAQYFFLIHMPHVLVFNFCLQEYKIITISSLGFGCCHFMSREENYYNVRRYEQ